MLLRIKRLLIGEPLANQFLAHEKIPKWKALAVLSSDALSSVAYATEEILLALTAAAAASAAFSWSLPVSLLIGLLMLVVTISYRQTISAYPNGGGAYVVAKENLGVLPGLVAGASLLIDYVLTVAVSIAAGVAAITSAFPFLVEHKIALALVLIVILTVMNLRGLQESATIFAFPTYAFIFSALALVLIGSWRVANGQIVAPGHVLNEVYPELPLFLLLRAFSSGCAAMTGIEAISNAVPAFRPPAEKNAKITLTWMSALLAVLFIGLTILAHQLGVAPKEGETVLSQIARSVFGLSPAYYLIQVTTALILVLAANTSYTGFPGLASILAKDRYLPRQLASLGDKLVFSNGIIGLSIAASFLVILFNVDVHGLVPLYAVGVFLSFTLSQAGMVIHHLREKEAGWIRSAVINGWGASATFVVLGVIAVTKFTHGAWIVIVLIPALVLAFRRVHVHYLAVGKELSLIGVEPPGKLERVKHTVIVPVSGIHRGVLDALRYAISISDDVRACYVALDSEATDRVKADWMKWAPGIPFVVLESPFRSVIRPVIDYVDDVEKSTHDDMVTVIIPEFVTAKWHHQLLHNQTALLIRAALLFKRGKVVTSVRYHLKAT
jgi:amino acid transporter